MLGWLRSLNPFGGSTPAPAASRPQQIRARYDNADTNSENKRNWWATDALSAKAANSFAVRRTLRMRSRYEVANNPFLFGVVHSNADDLIDTGPTLQIYSGHAAYDRAVEASWREWCAEVALVEKLKTAKLAKSVDGEGFLILKNVEDLAHPVKLYPCDIEADQVTTPAPESVAQFWVDGLTLHPVTGRPVEYHVLKSHPGDWYFPTLNPLSVDKIKARHVVHWFQRTRPGQVRGVPVFTPSLDLFTELRAFRRAVLGAAEIAADYAAVMEQDRETGSYDPTDDTDEEYKPFSRVPLARKSLTVMPPGAKLNQLDPKQPQTTYEMFQQVCLGEACRPLAYPLNLALGTSQKFNFSSAKLDHINYRNSLTIERDQCGGSVLEAIFAAWFEEAVLCGAIPVGKGLTPPRHEWHWPGFEPLDPVADAQADHQRLSNGTDTYQRFWARRGLDYRDVFGQQSREQQIIRDLGIEYGEPATKSVTENTTTDGDPPANASARRRRIRATKDDNGQEHDDDGKFGSGGGSGGEKDDDSSDHEEDHSEHHDKWSAEDEAREARESAGDAKLDNTREKEDAETQKGRDKEDAAHEKAVEKHDAKREKVEAAREKEDAKIDKAREKEDEEYESAVADHEAEVEGVNEARAKEDLKVDKARAKEDTELTKRQSGEEKSLAATHAEETAAEEKRRAAADERIETDYAAAVAEIEESRRDQLDNDIEPDYQEGIDACNKEHDEKLADAEGERDDAVAAEQEERDAFDAGVESELAELDARHTAEREALDAKRETEDDERGGDREREDGEYEAGLAEVNADREAVESKREAEDEERDAKRSEEDDALDAERADLDAQESAREQLRAKEDAERDAERDRIDTELSHERESQDRAEYRDRMKEHPGAHGTYYTDYGHKKWGDKKDATPEKKAEAGRRREVLRGR